MTAEVTAVEELATFAAALECQNLPPRIIEKARACLLYGASVGIAATPAPQPALAVRAGLQAGPSAATRFLDGASCDEEEAAFANAVLFHARCQEDAHPAGHIGAVVLPAALATAETVGASGADLIAGVVAGYEVGLRIGRDHAVNLSRRGFRTTSAYGLFAAAAAASRLRRLSAGGLGNALALAASMASGLREFVEAGSEEFAYQAGVAARNGLLAARLAAAGATGAASALTGAAGFFAAFGGSGRFADRLTDGLGSVFEMEAVAFKPWPVCQFHRASIAGLLSLRAQLRAAQAELIEIRMHPSEADFWGVRFTGPFQTFPQAFMSAPFCAALAWAHGEVGFAAMHVFDDDAVMKLIGRVHVIADEGRPRYEPHLRMVLANGDEVVWDGATHSTDFRLDWDAAVRFSNALCAEAGVPAALTARLIEAAESIDTTGDVEGLTGAIRKAVQAASTR